MSKKPHHGVEIESLAPLFEEQIRLNRSIQVIRVVSDTKGDVDVVFVFSTGIEITYSLYPRGHNSRVGILASNYAYHQMRLVLAERIRHGRYPYSVEQIIAAIKEAVRRARRRALASSKSHSKKSDNN